PDVARVEKTPRAVVTNSPKETLDAVLFRQVNATTDRGFRALAGVDQTTLRCSPCRQTGH
ncbi:MAG: hypothetical protein AAFY31_17080, partial [Pseudomonadota bacterium]